MKKMLVLFLLLPFSTIVYAQGKVREVDLIGQWELVLDIDKKIEKDHRRNDNLLAQQIDRVVASFVRDVVADIEILMDFRANGEVKISGNMSGFRETEYAEWKINRKGQLMIKDDSDDRKKNRTKRIYFGRDHDLWMMDGNKLIAYDRRYRGKLNTRDEVYMVKRR